MLLSLLITGLLILIYIFGVNPGAPPDMDGRSDVYVCGRIARRETKNSQTVLYLKAVFLSDGSVGDSNYLDIDFKTDIKDSFLSLSGETVKCRGVVCMPEDGEFKTGQTVILKGKLSSYGKATNPGGFDGRKYYGNRGYDYKLSKTKTIAVSEKYSRIREFLYEIKSESERILEENLGSTDAGIMDAMIFGDKTYLDREIKESYSASGISHVLAVSGLHISLLSGIVFFVFGNRLLPKGSGYVATVIFLCGYVLMVGILPGALRAAVMAMYRMAARIVKRSYDFPTAMAFSCLVTGIICPGLIGDSGFILSYLAVTGICLIYPSFLNIGEAKKGAADSVLISFSVSFMTLPVTMNTYYKISPYSILLNLCVLPCMSVLLPAGILVIVLGKFLPAATPPAVFVCKAILFSINRLAQIARSFPLGELVTGHRDTARVIAFYLITAVGLAFFYSYKRRIYLKMLYLKNHLARFPKDRKALRGEKELSAEFKRLRYAHAALLLFLTVFILIPQKKDSRITFLDVGQGDGICLENEGKIYLVDVGSSSQTEVSRYVLEPFLNYTGTNKVEGWFLTHPDSDHVSAFLENLENGNIKVGILYLPTLLKDDFEEIATRAENEGIRVEYLDSGDVFTDGHMSMKVLAPSEGKIYEDVNAESLVLRVRIENTVFYLTGDSGLVSEQSILDEAYRESVSSQEENGDGETAERVTTVLKVAHHGSAIGSNSEEFITGLKPDAAVISCGEGNVYGHPHRETIFSLEKAGCTIARTDVDGAVIVRIRGSKVFLIRYGRRKDKLKKSTDYANIYDVESKHKDG